MVGFATNPSVGHLNNFKPRLEKGGGEGENRL